MLSINYLFAQLQRLLPQHLLTRAAGWLASRRTNWVKNVLINAFSRVYRIDWSETKGNRADDYSTFNAFFTRELKPGARPLDSASNQLISPCDGTLSEYGTIDQGQLLQAKSIDYPLNRLLGCNDERANTFMHGQFSTIYLAPSNYHRVHMPISGVLTHCTHIPGRLFSVSIGTAQNLPGLFCRNERVVCWFEDDEQRPFALILVGAMMVGSIETVWHGRYQHRQRQSAIDTHLPNQPVMLQRGEEMGRFLMGSTVIMVLSKDIPDKQINKPSGSVVSLNTPLS